MEPQNTQTGEPEKDLTSHQATTPSSPVVATLQSEHPDWISEVVQALGETTIFVPRENIADACAFLKSAPGLEFNFLSDICGFDRGPEEEPRFEVNYHLFSTTKFHRVRLKVLVNEDDAHVPSVTGVWRTANWHERETYDLFGVIFDNHPDLRRILLPDDWQGHALRKDFPLRGYEPYSLE
jgi:NADH-quinone oxidoreductase subunit C